MMKFVSLFGPLTTVSDSVYFVYLSHTLSGGILEVLKEEKFYEEEFFKDINNHVGVILIRLKCHKWKKQRKTLHAKTLWNKLIALLLFRWSLSFVKLVTKTTAVNSNKITKQRFLNLIYIGLGGRKMTSWIGKGLVRFICNLEYQIINYFNCVYRHVHRNCLIIYRLHL